MRSRNTAIEGAYPGVLLHSSQGSLIAPFATTKSICTLRNSLISKKSLMRWVFRLLTSSQLNSVNRTALRSAIL